MESSQEGEEKNKRRRCDGNTTLGCPNCTGCLLDPITTTTKTTTSHDLCELCHRLNGETVNYSSTITIKNNNINSSLIIDDNKCSNSNMNNNNWWYDKKKMIKHSCSWLSFYQLGTFTCASTVVRWNTYQKKISWINLLWIAIILFSLPAASNGLSDHLVIPKPNSTQVCQSIDIRNSVSQFEKLRGCRVIEGFLQILLINHANDTAYANLTFPDLVEITGYLLLYRVNGLKSFGKLFPNLAIIRGHFLFINYALVVFEMMHLQELAFYSLTHIQRGAVRFSNNPSLCYVNTIDWDIIAPGGKGENVVSGNRPRNGCPVCDDHCPNEQSRPDEFLCWNKYRCQKNCYGTCGDRSCNDSGDCCHPSCIGGCDGDTEYDCRGCKAVTINETRCVDECPPGTYNFMDRRCISEDECRLMPRPREAFGISKAFPYKLFNNTCIIECPAGYMEEEINRKSYCKKCDGVCLKVCSGANVENIASAQKLRGCTHISGSLEIQIRGGRNTVKELEENLNMIEQIDGYLKIVRSFSLLSLNFLKSLKYINGNDLDNNKYSLTVLDNHNLQELWDWETHPPIKIKSKNGLVKVFFHHNPKLCLHKIERLRDISDLPPFKEADVASISNGDKVACNVTELKAVVAKKMSEVALIQWEPFQHHDPRSLLGYVVYFIEALHQNVTMYDGRDACGGDGWRVDDVAADNSNTGNVRSVNALLTQLKPYTQYAFYIKTYTIATEKYGAQSKIYYFTTLPGTPSPVRAIDIRTNSSSELFISWKPPARKNGNITYYRLFIKHESDDGLDGRNYCIELPQHPEKKTSTASSNYNEHINENKEKSTTPITCNCADRESTHLLREKEATSAIAFEDALHNQVYVKKSDSSSRKKRAIQAVDNNYLNMSLSDSREYLQARYSSSNDSFEIKIPASNLTYLLQNLKHYSVYSIELQACREVIPNDLSDACSPRTMRTARTKPNPNADDIPPGTFKVSKLRGNNSRMSVKLQWEEPPAPNGIILTYQIEYKRVDILDVQPTPVCITRKDFNDTKKVYIIRELPSGNYSIKVRAVTLAGIGGDSEIQFIYIEESSSSGFWIIYLSLSSILLIIFTLGGLYLYKRQIICNDTSRRLIATVNPEYVSSVYVPDEWEVARKKIRLLKELGNGSFGMVYEGFIKDLKSKPEIRCAVKTVNEHATDRERIEFLNEASVMKAFNTHHVVRLLGVVSRGQPTLVVMELMVNGDLKTYLRSHRPDQCENMNRQPPTLKRIIRMAAEIADGMAYLSAKKFVHRDLAARNCMVAEDLTVKIGDFGMTRDIYETDYYRKGTKGLLPVRWMAPESLKDGVFTTYSDVWSYGVVLWEMVTLASQPYQGLSNDQVLRYVIDGGVMERPENCPDSLYSLMRRTWNQKVTRRPTFIDIATIILQDNTLEGFEDVSFYHSPEGIEARNQNISNSPQNDKDFELTTLEDLREDQGENIGEDSPLRGDFEDFANIEQNYLKNNSVDSNRFNIQESYGENSKISTIFHDLNSSKIPLKAGFDDFDGVSGGSLCSSKDTLDFPFVEDSLKSVKNSPSIRNNNTPLRNISPISGKNSTQSPQNKKLNDTLLRNRAKTKSLKNSPDYENRTPELISTIEGKDVVSMRIDFSSLDNKDIDSTIDDADKPQNVVTEKTENLNNGYIGGTAT